MAKLSRYTQLLFGSTAGSNQMAEFGSLAAGSPNRYSGTTITPAIIQTLGNYLSGWFGAVVGENAPAIEDMNALFYLVVYQLCYLFEEGVPEWDSATTYYAGSIVNSGGILYVSLQNSNTNHAVTNTTWWKSNSVNIVSIDPSTQSPYTMTSADSGKTFLVNSANGAMQFNLPAAALNFSFKVVDSGINFLTNNCTIHRNGAESIMGVASDYIAQASGGVWQFSSDGTNWFITGR